MHRRTSIEAVGGWDEAYITSQDSDLSMRLLKAGHVLYRDPAPEVRMHKRNTLSQWWKMGHRYGAYRCYSNTLAAQPGWNSSPCSVCC